MLNKELAKATRLESLYNDVFARYEMAVSSFTGEKKYKSLDIQGSDHPPSLFELPMIPFRWMTSFSGLESMMIDDNEHRSICLCRSKGSVRMPPYSHKRNERIIVIEGKIRDFIMKEEYGPDSIIDYPMNTIRDLEFIDCVFNIILTPPLDFKK